MSWQEVERRSVEEGVSIRVVAMEVMQVHLLDAIFGRAESESLAFQGGTCIRMVYGGKRYSEDLDFVDVASSEDALDGLMQIAASRAGERLAAALGPGDPMLDPMKSGEDVLSWWFRYRRSGAREVLRVKLEVGRYPAREVETRAVNRPALPFLPVALVRACSLRELLADKVNALAQRPHLKGRDLYDIWFLRSLGVQLDRELAETKFEDYGTLEPLKRLNDRVDFLDAEAVRAEMERFLPAALRRHFEASGYLDVLDAVRAVTGEMLK